MCCPDSGSNWSLYEWIKRYSIPPEKRLMKEDQAVKPKSLEAELKRVIEGRDVLKLAAAYFAKQSGRGMRSIGSVSGSMRCVRYAAY